MLESGHRVQHHQLPFGFIQLADELIQDEPIGFVSRRGAQKSLPILKGNGGAALCLPQFLQAEVARDGQNPGHGLAHWPVVRRSLKDAYKAVLRDVLRVLGAFQDRKGEGVDRGVGDAVERLHGVRLSCRQCGKAVLQLLLRLLCGFLNQADQHLSSLLSLSKYPAALFYCRESKIFFKAPFVREKRQAAFAAVCRAAGGKDRLFGICLV